MSLPLPQVPWFTNLSIGKKLALAVAPLLLSLVFSTLAYEYANNRQLGGREMSNRFHQAVKHAKTVYECMLQARRGEKDFLLRLDEKYVEEVTNQITCIQTSAFDLQEMATQLDERVLAQDSEKMITLSQEYHARFDDIAEMWRKKGLTPESGFQGQFRKSAHALEKAINNLDTSTLWRIYLEMRRNEKDFAVRTKQEYRSRFETNLQHFQKSLQESRLDESVRKEINDLLQGYVQQVQSYMTHRLQGEALDVELPLYKAQSESAHKLEEAIRQRYVNNISTYYLLLRRYEKDYLLRDDKKYVQQLQQMVGKINQEIKASQVPQQGQDTLLSLVSDYERAFILLTTADEKIMLASELMRKAIHAVEPVIEHLITTMNRVESERLAEIDAEVDHSVTLARWVSLMASLLGLVVVLIVGRAIIVPVRRVANFLVDIGQKGEGDLRFRLPADRHDELGRLAQGFNLFMGCLEVSMREIDLQSRTINGNVTALNNMRIEIMGVAHSIHQAMVAVTSANRGLVQETNTIRGNSGQVLERVQEMTQAAKILKEHVHIISQAAESGSDSAQSLAGNVDSASSGVSQVNGNLVAVSQQLITVSSAVEEMTISLREVGNRCERAANRSQEVTVTTSQASRVMGDLSRAAREINKVVNAIRGIAGQTNLLALNAAIEAAGAGEAGKGFAVVANEVKELSKQTAEATRMISQEIDHIQKQIDVARQGMEGIDQGIQEITQLNQDISSAVQEQNLTVTEIARSLAKVSDATSNVTQAALQIEANLAEVSQAASQAQQQAWQQASTAREVDKAANTVSQGVTIALDEMVQVMDAVRRTDSEAQLVLDHTLQVNRLASKAMGISEAFGHIIDLTTTTAHALHGIRSRLAINETGMFNISDLKSDFLNQFQLLEVSMLGDKDIEDRLQSLFGPMSREENSMSRWLSTEASRLFPNRMELIELRNALDKVFELGSRILILGGQLQECHAQVMLSDDEQFSRQVEEYEAEIQTTMQSFRGVHHRIFLLLDALFRDPHGKGHFKDACGTMEQLEEAVQENDGVELF